MTITVLPMDATAGAPAYSALNARQAQAAVYGAPTGAFSARSGWRVGTATSVVSVTSTTWTLNPCSAMISPAAILYQGSYGWASDQAITGPVTAADGTNPRLDILYIQVNDSSAGDGSGGLSAPVLYLAGTPAATPVAPTLPPRSFLVATISVPKVGGGAPVVALNQQYFVAAGAVLPVYSLAEFVALTPYAGMAVCRLDIPGAPIQTYDGTKWWGQPDVQSLGLVGLGIATTAGSITLTTVSGVTYVDVNLTFVFTSAPQSLSTTFLSMGFPLPLAARSSTAPSPYLATWMSGGNPSFDTPVNVFLNVSTGQLLVRLQSGGATTNAGVTFSVSFRYIK